MNKHFLRRFATGVMAVLPLLFSGCLDPIELDPPRGTEDALVIQAELIYGDPSRVEVRLNQLYNFSLTSINPAFAFEVLLEDEKGNQVEIGFAEDGLFRLSIPQDDPDERIYGYFYATQRDTTHLYISPDLVGNPEVLFCEGFIGEPEIPGPCEDCLSEDNSQLVPPPFWDPE